MTKAEELYKIWKNYKSNEWKKRLRKVGCVSEEDVNGFLKLVGEREEWWYSWILGYFVSFVLNKCYQDRFIELDVDAVEGKINVGRHLDWDGVIYVRGDVRTNVGYGMKRGKIVVEGDVGGYVGESMEGGVIIVDGNVDGNVGWGMKDGVVVVKGNIRTEVGLAMKGGYILVSGNVGDYVGRSMKGGFIYIGGKVENERLNKYLGKGVVDCNGIWYFSRWVE